MSEYGRDWDRAGGEYVEEGALDFDVFPYKRPLGGWSVVVRQGTPQQMQEELGRVVQAELVFTVDAAGGLTEHHEGVKVDADALRMPWAAVPPDVQAEVFAAAGTGWVWRGVEHRFDPVSDRWVRA